MYNKKNSNTFRKKNSDIYIYINILINDHILYVYCYFEAFY